MRLLVIHHQKLTSKRREEIETAKRFLEEHTPYQWGFEYRYEKDLEEHLVIEDGDNLDEHAIKDFANSPADFVFLDISPTLWHDLRLRKTLYGQAEYIDPQGVFYGRWTQGSRKYVKRLPKEQQYLSEVGLGIVHELGHLFRAKYNMPYAFHSYAYGYKELLTKVDERKGVKPERWEVTPYIQDFYASIPFNTPMTDLKYKGEPAITTIVLHHTAVSRAVQPLQLASVESHHKQQWNDLSELGHYTGYNFFCEATGARTQTRFIGEETIAQVGNNCDVPQRCGMISYCMSGDFRREKPTQYQVDDFVEFVREVRKQHPNVIIKQHKDVQADRTCAELEPTEIAGWFSAPPTNETDKEKIARLESELVTAKAQIKQLIGVATALIKLITK